MIKLCVGAATVEDLLDWQRTREPGGPWIKGIILCRQPILAVNTVGEGVTARCEVTLDPTPVRVAPTPRRAFQGWRYLDPKDAPQDLKRSAVDGIVAMPPKLRKQLAELGLL